MHSIDCKIVPIFNPDETVCKDFERVELSCDDYLGRVYKEEYRQQCSTYHMEIKQEESAFAFAAYYKNQMIGFSDGYVSDDVMNLDSLFIHPMYHGFGVGGKLLKKVERSAGLVKSNIELMPLVNAIGFYQRWGYNYNKDGIHLIKRLPEPDFGVIPVFEWSDELQAKLNVKIDSDLLKQSTKQPMFVYVGKNKCIDGVAVRLQNGEQYIKLNNQQKSLEKYRRLELSCALDDCR